MNNSGAVRRDYGQLLNDSPGQTQAGLIRPSQYGDFDQNYQAMASVGRTPGSYTADGGETLSDVARAVWGDAGLWYLIASENGLKGTETLLAGTVLRLPNVNTNLHNAAGVNRPYEPGQAIGDVSPTLVDPPQPLKQKPKKKKSGGLFKKILVVIVVVVVSYFTAGAASGWAGSLASTFSGTAATGAAAGTVATVAGNVVAYAAVGAIANAAGQLASMALGLQDGFNWSAVGKAALTGGITGGAMAGLEMLSNSGSALADTAGLLLDYRDVTQAVTYNLASQSVNMALGEQRSFSWTSLAAAAIARPVSNRIAGQMGLESTATDLLGAVASEGIESALYGREFDWAGVAGNFVNASMMRNSASTQANRTQNEQYLDQVAARISQTGNQSPNASGWDTAPFGEVVVTARRPEDYRLYASVNDLIDQHLNGDDSLSTDMDPAFQRQGGTVAEWNRLRADYARQSQDTGPIRLSPVRVHVDAEGKSIEYPAGPGAGGTETGSATTFYGPARAGYALPADGYGASQAPLGSEANPGRLEEVVVTARRDSGLAQGNFSADVSRGAVLMNIGLRGIETGTSYYYNQAVDYAQTVEKLYGSKIDLKGISHLPVAADSAMRLAKKVSHIGYVTDGWQIGNDFYSGDYWEAGQGAIGIIYSAGVGFAAAGLGVAAFPVMLTGAVSYGVGSWIAENTTWPADTLYRVFGPAD